MSVKINICVCANCRINGISEDELFCDECFDNVSKEYREQRQTQAKIASSQKIISRAYYRRINQYCKYCDSYGKEEVHNNKQSHINKKQLYYDLIYCRKQLGINV